jgi:protein-tyrosine phosphatase
MIKIIFVCLGNICRSPLAEGILKSMAEERGLSTLLAIDSAGTSNYHIGKQPDPRTIANAKMNNLMLDHKGRQFCTEDLNEYDYILAMDRSNLNNIIRLSENVRLLRSKVLLMREFDNIKDIEDVPDPYHGGEEGFQKVYDILLRSNQTFIDFLIREHQLETLKEGTK